MTYSPTNRTIAWGKPLPWENCAGEATNAPKSGILLPTTVRLGTLPPRALLPRVLPGVEKVAEDFGAPFAASAAAERMAVRSAVALAPRMVSFTVVPLRMRKVGMLYLIQVSWCSFACLLGDWLKISLDLRGDAVCRSDIALIIDVDFGKDDATGFGFGGGKLFEDRGDDLTRSAPVRVEVHNCVRRGCDDALEMR